MAGACFFKTHVRLSAIDRNGGRQSRVDQSKRLLAIGGFAAVSSGIMATQAMAN
jgi:hypothetical protein